MKLKLVFVFFLLAQICFGQNLFTKAISKIAKGVGKSANIETTSNLAEVIPTVSIGSNLHSDKLGTISQTFFNGWVTGGDMCFVMFTGKDAPGFRKLDGSVMINGVPAEFVTAGMYNVITPTSQAPRKFEVTTASGKSNFTITPYSGSFKIKSINGVSDKISLDLTKDVEIELEGAQFPDNALLKVSIAINQLSIKSIYDVVYLRASGSKIKVPAAAFRNINIIPGGNALYNYKKSYLAVSYETLENATDVSGVFPTIQYTRSYSDGKFVNITTEPLLNLGLVVKGTEKDMDYQFYKPNAFLSRPFDQIKKVGLLSFSIRGTTYRQSVESSTSSSTLVTGDVATTTTTTKTTVTTLEFPQQPNEVWDKFLEQMYPEFTGVIESEFNANALTPEATTNTPSYSATTSFAKDDVNTKVEFARSFRKTKVLSAFMPMSEGFGVNGINNRVMNEAGADALLTMTLDLQISEGEDGKILMTPKLAFEIVGKQNGLVSNTKYVKGNIQSSAGVPFKKDITPTQLENIIRKSDLLVIFRKALQEIKAQEKSNGDYELIWSLQK